jgi:hypothetical protein
MIRANTVARALAAAWMAFAASAASAADVKPATAHSVVQAEIQVSLCSTPDDVVRALGLTVHGPAMQVWLFDDDALALYDRGLRFRLRVAKDQRDLTVKVAGQDCAQFAAHRVPPGEGKCEVDLHGASVAGAVSLSRELDAGVARDLVAGRVPLADALGPTQVRYLRDVIGAWPLPGDVRAYGPQRVTRYRTKDKRYDVDVARLPGGETYIEIARKVPAADAALMRDRLEAGMTRAGVAVCADQSAQAKNKLRALQRPR